MNLETLLKVAAAVGPAIASLPEFIELFETGKALLEDGDQAVAQEALADIQADNDEGHARLQAKLAEAAGR